MTKEVFLFVLFSSRGGTCLSQTESFSPNISSPVTMISNPPRWSQTTLSSPHYHGSPKREVENQHVDGNCSRGYLVLPPSRRDVTRSRKLLLSTEKKRVPLDPDLVYRGLNTCISWFVYSPLPLKKKNS